jgi:hypothetical protein
VDCNAERLIGVEGVVDEDAREGGAKKVWLASTGGEVG